MFALLPGRGSFPVDVCHVLGQSRPHEGLGWLPLLQASPGPLSTPSSPGWYQQEPPSLAPLPQREPLSPDSWQS